MYKILILVTFALSVKLMVATVLASKIKLNDGKEIPSLGLGTWLGYNQKGVMAEPTGNEMELAVAWAIDAGYRHIDTAHLYKVEDQVGRALANKMGEVARDEMYITTKLWNDRHAREAVVPALRESLQKLSLDYVDLYLIHWPAGQFANSTYDYTDYLETWRGMIEAKRHGLTKSIGVSNFNQQMIERILKNGLEIPAVLQVEVNLNLQQSDLLKYCKDKNIAVTGYTPFGSLFYNKAKHNAPPPRADDPNLLQIANKYNKTVPQVVLRFLVELGVIPIPKSLTKSRIEQNIDVFDFQLTEDERALLKSYDCGYRIFPQNSWKHHPYFPFEKTS